MAFDLLNTSKIEGGLRRVWRNAGSLTDGASGTYAGSADPGDICIDTTNKMIYVNTNTAASPTWSQVVTGGVAFSGDLTITGDITLTGDIALGTEDVSVAQGHMVYLDGQNGSEYLTSDAVGYATLNATTGIRLALGGTAEVSLVANNLSPTTSDGCALGSGTLMWSDLFIASAGVLNFNNSDVTITHSSNTLTLAGGNLAVAAGQFVSGAPVKELITAKTADTPALLVAESGVIDAQTDDIYLYLPTYVGNTGLIYHIKTTASFSAGVSVWSYSASELIDGANSKTSGAQYDALRVIAHSQGWHILDKIGTWS